VGFGALSVFAALLRNRHSARLWGEWDEEAESVRGFWGASRGAMTGTLWWDRILANAAAGGAAVRDECGEGFG
jgi:hypothetical protein